MGFGYGIGGMNQYNPFNGGLNNINWSEIANSSYFQQALAAPNLNNPAFKGSQSTNSETASSQISEADAAKYLQALQNASDSTAATSPLAGIPVTPQKESNSSLVSTVVGGTLLTGGAIACIAALKKGKFSDAVKWGKKLIGGTQESAGVLERLTAVRKGNNTYFMIPGKTVTKKSNEIDKFAQKYGLESSISKERQAFNHEASAINGFNVKLNNTNYNVVVENGNIIKICDGNTDLLQAWTNAGANSPKTKNLKSIQEILEQLGQKEPTADAFKNVSNIAYTNVFGDDVLKMTLSNYGANPTLNEFTTLGRYTINSPEMRSYVLQSGEKFFTNQKFLDGKLVDGAKVGKFSMPLRKNGTGDITINFDGREVVSFTDNGVVLPKGSAGYERIMNSANKQIFGTQYPVQKRIESILKDVFEKGNIPDGAVITAI